MKSIQEKKLTSLITLTVMSTACLIFGLISVLYANLIIVKIFGLLSIGIALVFAVYSWTLHSSIKIPAAPVDERKIADLLLQTNSMMEATKRLKEDQNNLLILLNSSADACWIKDSKGNYLYANHKFSQLSGLSLPELISLDESSMPPLCIAIQNLDQQVIASRCDNTVSVPIKGTDTELNIFSSPLIIDSNIAGTTGWITTNNINNTGGQWDLIDSLTQIGNRAFAIGWLDEGIQNNMTALAVLFFDINQFSIINTQYGNEIADLCLLEISNRLTNFIDENTQIARLAKDQFTILIRNITDADQILKVAEKASSQLNQTYLIEDQTIELKFSMGLGRVPENADSAWSLLHAAEIDMKATKTLN